MQVILLEKIVNLGQLGDVVKVKEGYARNFLIPQGKARRADLEKAQADKLAAAQSVQEKMSGAKVQVTAKAGVDGRLFGSITNYDIAEALVKQGFNVNKAQVRMPQGPLKLVGDHPLTVTLHSDVTAEITVTVVGEQA